MKIFISKSKSKYLHIFLFKEFLSILKEGSLSLQEVDQNASVSPNLKKTWPRHDSLCQLANHVVAPSTISETKPAVASGFFLCWPKPNLKGEKHSLCKIWHLQKTQPLQVYGTCKNKPMQVYGSCKKKKNQVDYLKFVIKRSTTWSPAMAQSPTRQRSIPRRCPSSPVQKVGTQWKLQNTTSPTGRSWPKENP